MCIRDRLRPVQSALRHTGRTAWPRRDGHPHRPPVSYTHLLENVTVEPYGGVEYHKGTLAGKQVVVCCAGMGKANAAAKMCIRDRLWGNPLYNWPYHKQTGYAWWIRRVRHALGIYDQMCIRDRSY